MVTVTVNRNGNIKTYTYKRQSRFVFNRVVQTINADITITFTGKGWTWTQPKAQYIEWWIAEQELIEMGKRH